VITAARFVGTMAARNHVQEARATASSYADIMTSFRERMAADDGRCVTNAIALSNRGRWDMLEGLSHQLLGCYFCVGAAKIPAGSFMVSNAVTVKGVLYLTLVSRSPTCSDKDASKFEHLLLAELQQAANPNNLVAADLNARALICGEPM